MLKALSFCLLMALAVEPAGAENALQPVKGNLVNIGAGRRLNLVCTGKGTPTVVFLQGLGGAITSWRHVRGPISDLTRTCAYDRAGFGYSDASSLPSSGENVTDDLHALLHAAGITGRVILVGHSLGGLFATLYADKFGPEVAGLVLVDPSSATQFDYSFSPQAKETILADDRQFLQLLHTCETLTEQGALSSTTPHNCLPLPPNLAPDELDYLTSQITRPSYFKSGISEFENFNPMKNWTSIDGIEELKRARSFGNKPLIVLSADVRPSNPKFSDAENKGFADYIRHEHVALAGRSKRGELVVVPGARHDIQVDRPKAVIGAIRKVVLSAHGS